MVNYWSNCWKPGTPAQCLEHYCKLICNLWDWCFWCDNNSVLGGAISIVDLSSLSSRLMDNNLYEGWSSGLDNYQDNYWVYYKQLLYMYCTLVHLVCKKTTFIGMKHSGRETLMILGNTTIWIEGFIDDAYFVVCHCIRCYISNRKAKLCKELNGIILWPYFMMM